MVPVVGKPYVVRGGYGVMLCCRVQEYETKDGKEPLAVGMLFHGQVESDEPGKIMWFWADQLGEEATPEIVQREYDESFARGVACNNSSCWCRKFIKLSKRGVSL